jgi:hypothetical protein
MEIRGYKKTEKKIAQKPKSQLTSFTLKSPTLEVMFPDNRCKSLPETGKNQLSTPSHQQFQRQSLQTMI